MSQGPEANFWKSIKANAPPTTLLMRIENRHGGGVPDVHGLIDKLPFWAELKVTGSVSIDLAQKPWTEVQGQRFEDLGSMWEALRADVRGHYARIASCAP
jgi:hypothetical protein